MDNVAESATDATSDEPSVGLAAVRSLHLLADRLEVLQVRQARNRGWSWQEIGRYLGVSRQAVHRKYSRLERQWLKDGGHGQDGE